MFSLLKDLREHDDTVNCLEFSPDGSHLASGDDQGLLNVFNTPSGTKPKEFQFEDSVTALAWCGTKSLFVGLASCEVHFISLGDEKTYSLDLAPSGYTDLPGRWKDIIQINCISFSEANNLLAVGVGVAVVVMPNSATHVQACAIAPLLDSEIPDARAAHSSKPPTALPAEVRSIQFIEDGRGLLVTFLEQGIRCYDIDSQTQRWSISPHSFRIGRSALDAQAEIMVCSNLNDGFDLYDLKKRRWVRTIHREVMDDGQAIALPVAFLNDDSRGVLMGSSCGTVVVSSLTTPSQVKKLDHGRDIIEAVAAFSDGKNATYLATACADKGKGTYVRLWVKAEDIVGERRKRPARERSRMAASNSTDTEASSNETPVKPGQELTQPRRILRQAIPRQRPRRRREPSPGESEPSDDQDRQVIRDDQGQEAIDEQTQRRARPSHDAGSNRRTGRVRHRNPDRAPNLAGCAIGVVVGLLTAIICAFAFVDFGGPSPQVKEFGSNSPPSLSSVVERRQKGTFSTYESRTKLRTISI